MSPELIQYLTSISVAGAAVAVLVAILVVVKKVTDSRKKKGCIKTDIPEDGEQEVCLKDEYAASSVRPYLKDQDDCPDCPECYCSAHHMNCPDNFRRLRELASSLLLESTLHEGSRFELGQAAAYGSASAQLTDLLNELEGKDVGLS